MIVVIGLSHRTAPIAVRERLAMGREDNATLLGELVQCPEIAEALLLSTCNRVELALAPRAGTSLEEAARVGSALLTRRAPDVARHFYVHQGGAGVRHLFRVASSLDSLVLGEPQILGQLKDAFDLSRERHSLGPVLYRVVPRAIRAAKRVRTETALGAGQVSVPSIAVDLARQIFGELGGRAALLVGSGEMAETVARLLHASGVMLLVTGRNSQRTGELAESFGGRALPWSGFGESLVEADVVITSTSAPGYVISREMVRGARRSRRGRNLFFIDLAVPRDVEPETGELDGVFVYNIDDFSRVVAESLASREQQADRAEQIILEETEGYERWAHAMQATPTIIALRRKLEAVLEMELDKTLRGRLKHLGTEERDALQKMLAAAVKKLLYAPTARLREVASHQPSEVWELGQLAGALHELFGLGPESDVEAEEVQDAPDSLPKTDPPPTPHPQRGSR